MIAYTWCEEFLMQSTSVFMCSQVCLCVIEGQLGFERLSKSCTMSGRGKMALSFNSSFA